MEDGVRIGNQTSGHAPPRDAYQFALRNGFDAFEWFSDPGRFGWCEDQEDAAARGLLCREASGCGMVFSVHAPVGADPVTPQGAQAVRRSITFAGDIGAAVVNLHLFTRHGARRFAESLGPLLEAARAAGARLSLENTPETSPDDFNAVFGVLASIPEAAGGVGMCLDMGHANLHSGTKNDYVRYADCLGDHVPIIHWHVHENWGDRDSHLTLFTGPAARDDRGVRGLVRRLLARGFRGCAILEQWPQPPELLVAARQRLRTVIRSLPAGGG
jgi:sugar phosphate isomerase/epimerase